MIIFLKVCQRVEEKRKNEERRFISRLDQVAKKRRRSLLVRKEGRKEGEREIDLFTKSQKRMEKKNGPGEREKAKGDFRFQYRQKFLYKLP